ncbi:MAG: flagellar basal body P-ring protein FlgI [Mariniblastus sp.]|nr:flagellar basal body P-ring protein FlgI [Mariniblastus sp.]
MNKKLSVPTHANDFPARSRRRIDVSGWAFLTALFLVGLLGCGNIIPRGQSPDESIISMDNDAKRTIYISDVCKVWGLNYAPVEGVGLVSSLDGTGSNPVPSGQRDHLLSELKNRSIVEDPKKAIASENTSMVLVKGLLPPGIKKGERFDVEVQLMPKSDTSSLMYGKLMKTRMRPMMNTGRSVKLGTVNAVVNGSVMVDSVFETRQDGANHTRGWIFGGGVALEDRKMALKVFTDQTKVKLTRSIAYSINNRFTTVTSSGRQGVATAKSDRHIALELPDVYKHNIGRYFQVLVNMAVDERADLRVNRLDRLDLEINDPSICARAALELEAFGEEGVPALKRALKNPDSVVRFNAAQALAYMQHTDGVEDLVFLAEKEPAYRWHALTALASLNEPAAANGLNKLMHVKSAETRYGAFRALQKHSPSEPAVDGQWLADDFYFHVVPSTTDAMLHFSRSKLPEIVAFGETQTVSEDFLYVETGLTVKGAGDGRIQITRYMPQRGEIRKECSTRLVELIPTLADLGCDYTVMVNLFREAMSGDMLESRLVVNAVPRIRNQNEAQPDGGVDSGDLALSPMAESLADLESLDDEFPEADGASEAETKTKEGMFTRFKNWFSD